MIKLKGDCMDGPQLDESQAPLYIGKTILIGVTYVDCAGKLIEQRQWAGKILTFSNQTGIKVELFDSNEPCCLPPDPSALVKAEPGSYRLRSTGRIVEDPDYLTTWIRKAPDPAQKAEGKE